MTPCADIRTDPPCNGPLACVEERTVQLTQFHPGLVNTHGMHSYSRSHNVVGQTRLMQDGNRHLELGLVVATSHGTLKNRHQVVAVGQVDYELVTQRARALSKGTKETSQSAVVRYEYTSKPLTSELCPPDRTTGWIPLAAAHWTTRTYQNRGEDITHSTGDINHLNTYQLWSRR